MEFPEGLQLAVIMEREDPRDSFVSNRFSSLDELPEGAVVGTSSLRRSTQLREVAPHLEIKDLRGNVNTRLKKLDDGEYDAIILASAGLIRLGFEDRIASRLTPEQSLPAMGQGAIGIECRTDDPDVETVIAALGHEATAFRVLAERAMNNRLNGGCQVPIAGFALLEGDELYLRGLVGEPDGSRVYRAEARMKKSDAETLGKSVAEDLLSQGAGDVLAKLGLHPAD